MALLETQLRWRDENRKILNILCMVYPKTFFGWNKPCRPLKIGIFNDVADEFPEITKQSLKRFFRNYTHRRAYRDALATRKFRVDLDGNRAGKVDGEVRQASVLRLSMYEHSMERAA